MTFRRLILGLNRPSTASALRLTAQLADRLKLEMLGLYIEDQDVLGLPALSFAREIRSVGGNWHAIEREELTTDLAHACRLARSRFDELMSAMGRPSEFAVRQGSMSDAIGSILRSDDVIAIAEPANPADRFSHQFQSICDAAFKSSAAVLMVPARVVRQTGPVMAIAGQQDDLAVAAAASIARLFSEELSVLRKLAGTEDVVFEDAREQLIVVARGTVSPDGLSALAAIRRVPVLGIGTH